MNKKIFYIITVALLIFAIGGCNKTVVENNDDSPVEEQEIVIDETTEEGEIIEISVDDVKGISPSEAEELCYLVMGEADEETGFPFSFGVKGAIEKGKKQYYVIRASWLVENSHLSYIGDFFVSADGKEVYEGTAILGEYEMLNKVWSE